MHIVCVANTVVTIVLGSPLLMIMVIFTLDGVFPVVEVVAV